MDRARRRIHSSGTVAELFLGYVADYEIYTCRYSVRVCGSSPPFSFSLYRCDSFSRRIKDYNFRVDTHSFYKIIKNV